MGNCISNATDGHNPTYEYRFDEESNLILHTKDDAEYDFHELDHHTILEAAQILPKLVEGHKKFLRDEIIKTKQQLASLELRLQRVEKMKVTREMSPPDARARAEYDRFGGSDY